MTTNRPPVTMRPGLAHGISVAMVLGALVATAAPALAQEQVENELRYGLHYNLFLPKGWESFVTPNEAIYFTREGGGRMVQIVVRADAYLSHDFIRSPTASREGSFSGYPATIFSGDALRTYLPTRDAVFELWGTRQHVHFRDCAFAAFLEPPQTAFALIVSSNEAFTDPMQDPILAPVLDTLHLTLPDEVEDCPASMTEALVAVPAAPQPADDEAVFTRFGLSIWLPASFGAPAFEMSYEITWLSPGLEETGRGVGVIFGTVPTREYILDDLGPDDVISSEPITLNSREFDRVHFSIPTEDFIGTLYLSREAYHEDEFVSAVVATQIAHWDEFRDTHDVIAERIESLNSK